MHLSLKEEKVAHLVTIPLMGGGTKRQLVKKIGEDLGVGAAFCGRSAILPLLGPNATTSAGAQAANEICQVLQAATHWAQRPNFANWTQQPR